MIGKRIVTYSLLAHINNNNVGIRDFSDIFTPLIKRVISKMNTIGKNKGESLQEIKDCISEQYSLDIPYPILSKIVKSISYQQNKNGDVNFQLFDDGSFIISNFTFSEYEGIIQEQEAEIDYLNEIYNNFIVAKGAEIADQKTIFEFLEQNKISLSKYFADNVSIAPEIDSYLQADFVNSVKNNKRVYNILKKVYLGSIISAYLSINENNTKTDLEFLIDTNFIIGLLDLGSIEENHTCKKIIEIGNQLGCRLCVLDFTIEETEALLSRTAENFENSFLPKKVDPQSIYNACDRNNISKTDLQEISHKLASILQKDFNVQLIPYTTKLKNIAKYSDDYKFYKKIRSTNYSALHDATAVTYVKQKRGKDISDFNSSKCWFVTNTSHSLRLNKKNGYLPEVIRADNLINILWLTNPGVNEIDVVNIGLSKLVSCAISNSLPNIRTLKELDENMQKYSKKGVRPEDVVRVATAVANKTIKNLEGLNKLAKSKPDEFVKQIHEISENVEKNQVERNEKISQFLEELTSKTEIRITKKIANIKKGYEEKEIENQSKNDDEREKLKASIISIKKESFKKLEPIASALDKKSSRFSTRLLLSVTLLPFLIILGLYFIIERKTLEFYIFPIGLIPTILSYVFFALFRKQYSPQVIFEYLKEKRFKYLIKKYSFDYDYYLELKSEINKNDP